MLAYVTTRSTLNRRNEGLLTRLF